MKKQLKEMLLEDRELTLEMCRALNTYDGSLEMFDIYDNDEGFFDLFFEGKPMEAVRATQYGNYNYMDEYVRFNGYGNVESLDQWKVNKEIEDYIDEIIDTLTKNYNHICCNNEIREILESEE